MDPRTKFSDDEIVLGLRQAFTHGAARENVGDKLEPPNLLSFFNGLPRPERDRLIGVATTSVSPANSEPTGVNPKTTGNTPPASSKMKQ